MINKRSWTALIVAMVMLFGVTGAIAEPAALYTPGTYEAAVQGYGGDVKVSMEFDENSILALTVVGDGETPAIGGTALETLKEAVLQAQSAEVDSVAGATVTSNAFLSAVSNSMNQALVNKAEGAAIADGTYEGSAQGHNGMVKVSVTVQDGQVADIAVLESAEQMTIGSGAFDIVKAYVLKNQSLAMDGVSGATVSGAAFVAAISNALSEAGADVDSMKIKKDVEPVAAQEIDLETDVLVIGAGITGLTAALEAANQGAKVILLERNAVVGGTAARSEGIIQAAETDEQKALGVEDTFESFYNDMRSVQTSETIEPEMVKKIAYESADAVNWLKDQGVVFDQVVAIHFLPPRDVPRGHYAQGKGGGMCAALEHRVLENSNIQLLMQTPASELIMDGDAVVGAKASNPQGDTITIRAKATILAAGGYTSNPDLMAELNPNVKGYATGNPNVGGGFTMAKAAGADMIIRPDGLHHLSYSVPGSLVTTGSIGFQNPDILMVTPEGDRYANESLYTFDRTAITDGLGFHETFAIVDARTFEKFSAGIEAGYEGGYSFTADSIEELAEKAGMDPAKLRNAVDTYNEASSKGVDEQFGKAAEYLIPLEGPHYYALRLRLNIAETYNGARINQNAQVISTTGDVIPGFYAAGASAMAQIVDQHYFGSGTAILVAVVFGRTAAQHAVATITAQ